VHRGSDRSLNGDGGLYEIASAAVRVEPNSARPPSREETHSLMHIETQRNYQCRPMGDFSVLSAKEAQNTKRRAVLRVSVIAVVLKDWTLKQVSASAEINIRTEIELLECRLTRLVHRIMVVT